MANTIKKLIDISDLEVVYNILLDRNTNSFNKDSALSIEGIRSLYGATCLTLLIKPNKEPNKDFKLYISDCPHGTGVDVSLLNLNYEKPKDGLEPWGCIGDSEVPYGYYDANSIKHAKLLSIGNTPWVELSNMDIIVDESCQLSNEEILANLLWEITFYGFDEKAIMEFFEDLNQSILQK